MSSSDTLRGRMRSELDRIAVIDSHEHTASQEYLQRRENHLFRFFDRSLVESDLCLAGAGSHQWNSVMAADMAAWDSLKPYLDLCRNTGYLRCFHIAVRDLLGIPVDELNDENWQLVSQALADANRRPDWYTYVLRERANIEAVLWDLPPREPSWPEMDRTLFAPVCRLDWLGNIGTCKGRGIIEMELRGRAATVLDLLDAVDALVVRAITLGVAGIKIGVAYTRDLRFGDCSRYEAARIFNTPCSEITSSELRSYQDFIAHAIIETAARHDLPLQVHTGMLSLPGPVGNGNPVHLEDTIRRHPGARFALLHGGYPFVSRATMLARTYPNVYVDASWLPLLSPSIYRRVMSEWLERVPVERIIAWGGDTVRVEMSYGSLRMARDAIADILSEKVESGCYSETEAIHAAQRILRENARELFRTDDVRETRLRTTPAGLPVVA